MRPKVERSVTIIVILLFSLRILGASAINLPSAEHKFERIQSKKSNACSALASFLFEKTEEGENAGMNKDGISRVVLIDFSQIAFSLSYYYSGQIQVSDPTSWYDVHPPVYQINCVYLI
jgi:hypothetical protein